MKAFFDCEFTGLRQDTTLISIGFVTEKGREFYAECTDYDRSQVDEFIQSDIVDKLLYTASIDPKKTIQHFTEGAHVGVVGTTREVGKMLASWLSEVHHIDKKPVVIWSDTLAYDWVLFCELFGGALSVPSYVYYIPFDIATLFKIKHIDPDIHRESFVGLEEKGHNALWHAVVIKACYEKLRGVS